MAHMQKPKLYSELQPQKPKFKYQCDAWQLLLLYLWPLHVNISFHWNVNGLDIVYGEKPANTVQPVCLNGIIIIFVSFSFCTVPFAERC
jgi:hypothetical protein